MATLPSDSTPKTDQLNPEDQAAVEKKKRNREMRQRIDNCKSYRRKLVANWTISIDYRRGKPFASQTDEDRIAVNLDWALTKEKVAALFSQVPDVRVEHAPDTLMPPVSQWLHKFEQRLNDTLVSAGIEATMEEVMPDCINAAGIGVVVVAREAITQQVQIPKIDVSMLPPQFAQAGIMPDGTPIPMISVPKVIDSRYIVQRVSPSDFLWPLPFTGSDFDNSPWVGRSGRISWSEAKMKWNLKDEDKASLVGEDRTTMDRLTHDIEKDKIIPDEMVNFDEIFFKEFQFDLAAQSFVTIHHLVFVTGKDDPVVDQEWDGQQIDPQSGAVVGATRYPIQVLTLAYLTDESIPPSDSAIGRPQVNELNKSRTQMIMQRERSLPVRWFDVNRIDPTIQQSLMRGVWQGMIPVQGQGANVIGEIQRSAMPPENFRFDQVAKLDLRNIWQMGEDSSGADVETKGEAEVVQSNRQTNVAKERAKVGRFYCRIAEVLGGLLCLYENPASFGQGFDPGFSRTLGFSILADSTVLLDVNARLQKAINFYNFAAKSGYIDLQPVLEEIATLSGFDPAAVVRPPQPTPPDAPNISLRLTGTEDMMNPLTLAFLINTGQAPSTKQIEDAKQLIQAAVIPPPNAIQPPPQPPQIGPDGTPMPPTDGGQNGPSAPPVPVPIGPAVPVTPPPPPPPQPGKAHPDLSAVDRVNKRVIER